MKESKKSNPGPPRYVTPEIIIELMEDYDDPVWTRDKLADALGVSRPTIGKRIDGLRDDPRVAEDKIGNAEVFYLNQNDERPIEEQHASSIKRHFEDKFVGLPTAPWTAVNPNDGPAEAGDKIQIRVEGTPGNWGATIKHSWENRREELIYEEVAGGETQALISGELYAKPTVPIEHIEYPDDYDLELNIGAEYHDVEGRDRPLLVAAGVKNYLVKPCDDAVFLRDVSVDWISPPQHGEEVPTYDITEKMIEEAGSHDEEDLNETGVPLPKSRSEENK